MKGVRTIIALYILLGIVLFICLILSLRIKLQIIYEDELKVYLKILFFKIQILPDKNKKFNISKFKRKKKQSSPAYILKDIKEAEPTSDSIIDKLNSVREIISIFFDSFHKHLHVKLTKIHVKVASSDAAKTAILYGTASTAVACVVDLIDEITNLHRLKESSISVEPDFLSDKTDIKLNIMLYISVAGAIKVLLKSLINYYISNNQTQINNRKEN